ncbi:SRPBCC family protein [Blastococcus sp. MG754426]|uniref:SRPBCC family protein n=1 Tax=unclassified Blastococcus TaxID=2619396 RepID=UPI001EF0F1E6|nr:MULTISPECIES: SRPBCC family protein [unclassified Blastococcus]MCF6506619.1 SRPBCC family protein [Blastococcus sp. MG754426]MCF6510331.1 SRPBCC family protein [Blastococcus sp. MG754427]
MTTKAEKSIQVDVPVTTAYNQWTQFEDFPHFMGGVKEVRQHSDQRLHWVAEIAGVRREWDATILEQVPDQKIAWAATEGATNAGAVRFQPVGTGSTLVHLTLEYEPEGLVEQVGDKLNLVQRQVESDLQRFKALVESEGYATGGWRGSINPGEDVGTPGANAAFPSRGDSGKAGVSGKAVAAGAAAVAGVAAAAAGAAAAGSSGKHEATEQPPRTGGTEDVAVVPQPPVIEVRDEVVVDESDAGRYATRTSTEGAERGAVDADDDPMIGGGSR